MIDRPEICLSAIGRDQVRLLPVNHGADAHFAYMSAVEVLLNLSMGGMPSTQGSRIWYCVKDFIESPGCVEQAISRAYLAVCN